MKRPLFIIAAVVALISGLTIIGLGAARMHLNSAKYAQTRAQIVELQEALTRYHADNGYYPTTDQGLLALGNYYVYQNDAWDGDRGMVRPLVSPRLPCDAWGNPYFYESDGDSYLLWSPGPHGFEIRRDAVVARSPKLPN
jgi:general secretion pathway protein G